MRMQAISIRGCGDFNKSLCVVASFFFWLHNKKETKGKEPSYIIKNAPTMLNNKAEERHSSSL
jgi:hypothetical protein